MIPVVVSQDWDAIRERPSSQASDESSSGRFCPGCCRAAAGRGEACLGRLSRLKDLGRHGWRTWCLFGFNFFLLLLVMINFGITLWLMTVMKFTYDGMGQLKITPSGVQLSGKAYVMDSLVASTISARQGAPIVIQTYDNFTVISVDVEGNRENRLFIDKDKFHSRASNFLIEDDTGRLLFSSSPELVSIGADKMRIDGAEGAIFHQSLETPLITSESGQNLRLQSLTRSLHIEGPQGISLESSAGTIEASCLKDINLKTKTGAIKLMSKDVIINNLQIAQSASGSKFKISEKNKIYQVCVCGDGRVFLASPKGSCDIYDSKVLCQL